MLSAAGLTKRYDTVVAVDALSMDRDRGITFDDTIDPFIQQLNLHRF